ncbi:MAG: hypothetical protein ACFFB2_16155, partial [Promethearchaeota archaeon]
MPLKYQKYFLNGSLLLFLFLSISSVSTIGPDNTLYPIFNYFAFGENGAITKGLHNQTFVSDEGMKIHEITSKQDAYKFRIIFKTPSDPFEMLSLRLRMIFTYDTEGFICWGGLHNVTVSVFPFDIATIEGDNNSVQLINARELYQGTTIQFHFNTSVFQELDYFELAISSWNETTSLQGVQFEQIRFHLAPTSIVNSQTLLGLFSSIGLYGFWLAYPKRFGNVLAYLFVIIMLITPIAVITQVLNRLDTLPQKEEGVTRFTFFNRVYERRDLGNGYFSLRMVKDLSTAFELQASSGTGFQVVYPKIENTSEDNKIEMEDEKSTVNEESSSPKETAAYEGLIPPLNGYGSFGKLQPRFGAGIVQIAVSNISITDSDFGVVHSRRTYYSFKVVASDEDGYGDLDFVQLNFTVNSFEYSVGYDNGTDTFSEINDNGANHISLGTGSTSRNGKYLTVTFEIQTDWDFPNGNNIALKAWANDTSSNTATETSSATYNFNHNIEVASFSVNDNNINPNYASDLVFTGNVYYEGTNIAVPPVEIDVVTIFREDDPIDINVAIENDTDDSVSISVDSEMIIGNYTYYPFVELAGDGLDFNGSATTTQEVHVDCVKITDITVLSNSYEYFDGSRYWDNNNGTFDDITINITAVWNYTGNLYQGEVNIGYIGNENKWITNGLLGDIEEDPDPGTTITRDGITVGSAVVGIGNDYGTQIHLSQGLTLPNVGWDNANPTLSDAMAAYAESGDTDEVYGDDSINIFYFSDSFDSSATITITATGVDADSGIRGIDFGIFGDDDPAKDSSAPYQGQYTINDADVSGTITVTIYDNVGNSASDTITCTEDGVSPSISITGESE